MAGEFRIFISAVTSEFGKARDGLAADLRSRNTLVRVQSDFRQEAGTDTTLKKLHDYIHDCSAVVCVIGARSGACPPSAAALPFRDMLPSGISEASYTQWEFFFARHYQRRLSIYIANPDYVSDQTPPAAEDRPDLQQALVRYIVEEQGLDHSYFSNVDQLARAVLKEDWAGLEVEQLPKILSVIIPQSCAQFRPTIDFKKIPAEMVGWMFQCQATITNRSTKSKISLDVSLTINMKSEFPTDKLILKNRGSSSVAKILWGAYPDELVWPLLLAPHESVRGVFYFWTGPMPDEKLREGLADLTEREDGFLPLASLNFKNLINDETLNVKIPTSG